MRRFTIGLMIGLALLVVLSGCVTQYTHPNKGQAGFDRDWAECNYQAKLATANMNVPEFDYTRAHRVNILTRTCITTKGWSAYYE